jgi:mannosylglycoprotein endo-beta-mannosidase
MEVPDIGEVGREHYTFWFCNKFKLSSVVSELISILVGSLLDNAGCSGEWLQLLESYDTVMSFGLWLQPQGGKVWLNFRAINYQAEVFLNGFRKVLSKGMFLRHTIDVTDWLDADGENLLAVLVHPPDHPGRIPLEGGQGGDHDVRWLVYATLQ